MSRGCGIVGKCQARARARETKAVTKLGKKEALGLCEGRAGLRCEASKRMQKASNVFRIVRIISTSGCTRSLAPRA